MLVILLITLSISHISSQLVDFYSETRTYPRENVNRVPFTSRTLSRHDPDVNNIRLGGTISYELHDEYHFYGEQMKNSWVLFNEWVNEVRGGVLVNGTNYTFAVGYIDDFSDSTKVQEGFEYLLSNVSTLEGLDIMLAPYASSLTRVAVDIAEAEVSINKKSYYC